jgi:hypothetical protein
VVLIANYLLSETNISSRCRLGTFSKVPVFYCCRLNTCFL